ncbi:hypothetical protein MRS76_05050 [Rhizobiaceae bacterium n13]|uniref:DUF1127 domain-containing protein n=1 Tax=Ferirhizobium litorale TaxID=2927786 RepID=A0AAE3U2K2_9HYPH|nr:hypothetical protein [Fererhizobium litorale]MDI7861316.1 hypothetical protein [Fererhizobium litorale]MDI7921463.1 hypothetical protein [Fererhizobium litorale]
MTAISYAQTRRGRFHFLFGSWFGQRRGRAETIEFMDLKGLDRHLMRDIGIEPRGCRHPAAGMLYDHTRY